MVREAIRRAVSHMGSDRLSRREVVSRFARLGLSCGAVTCGFPAIATMPARAALPSWRGMNGVLKILHWQALLHRIDQLAIVI